MRMQPCVRDVMTTEVVTVRRDTSFKEMATRLRKFRVSAFPVVDDEGKVLGVVSEGDLLAKEALADAQDGPPSVFTGLLHHKGMEKAEGLVAGDLMTQPAVTVGPGETVEHAARLMYNCRVKRLPVVDSGGRLVGIVSRADVLAVYDRSDEEIQAEITGVIRDEFGEDSSRFAVTVRSGVVTLEGSLDTVTQGHRMVRRARHVQGVVGVRDRLSYPPEHLVVTGPVF